MSSDETLYVVSIHTNHAVGENLDEMFPSIELYPTSYFDRDDDIANMSLYASSVEERDELYGRVCAAMNEWSSFIAVQPAEVIKSEMKREDWANSWKKFFHTVKVSDRLVIKPSWEDYTAASEDEIILEIDPGMSFGTGNHGTTKACLQFIDQACAVSSVSSLLDAGCGSGILSLAAVKLGCTQIDAFDYDPDAVHCAEENLQAAGLASEVNLFQADLTTLDLGRQYQVLVANILATVLLSCVDNLLKHLAPGPDSRLILSGILTEQYPELKSVFESKGLVELDSALIDEWTSGVFAFR